MCHWCKERIKRPSLDQEFGQVPFSLWLLREYLAIQLAPNFWGCGRKRENFWPVGDKEYVNNMLVPKTRCLQARENFSVFKIMFFYWCCSVLKRKAEKNWCRKKERLCMCTRAGVARGYPREPGTPGSSTALGREGGPHPWSLLTSLGNRFLVMEVMGFFCLNWGSEKKCQCVDGWCQSAFVLQAVFILFSD